MCVKDGVTRPESISERGLVQDGQTHLGSLRLKLVLAWRLQLQTHRMPAHPDRRLALLLLVWVLGCFRSGLRQP